MNKESIEGKIAEIKEATVDSKETKRYILKIKNIIENYYKRFGEEIPKEEIWEEFVEEYNKELKFRGNAEEIYNRIIQHVAIDKLISSEKGDRYTYNYIMRGARNAENANKMEILYPSMDVINTMIVLVRSAIRYNPGITEKRIMQTAPEQKAKIDKPLKEKLIENIQFYISYLNEYGFLDDIIESSNNILSELKLEKLNFQKRNPIPDEQYDEEGKLVKDVEDIGVIDAFDTEFLKKVSIEDLTLMSMAWECQYLQARLEMEKAIITIDSLNLYDKIINGNFKDIENLPLEEVEKALKKDLALTYIYRAKKDLAAEMKEENGENRVEREKIEEEALDKIVSTKLKRQYKKMLKESGFDEKEVLLETLRDINPEYENIYATGEDIAILQGVIIYLIEQKALKLKKWGKVDASKIFEDVEENPGLMHIALENAGFRGPIVMEVPKEVALTIIKNCKEKEIPEYNGYIDEKYSRIMAKLLIPSTQYFKNTVKQRYKEDPTSRLNAALAGKSVKNEGR